MVTKELLRQIEEARQELSLAEQDERYADPEYLDIAIERVNLVKKKLNLLYKQSKL